MKLKKLELFGFKSFADHTEFDFNSGITGIVGPNGCGKSNVVDAVKWVLGEQRPKSLRGREMTDVIFSGSATRSSLGYAEAALTFSNGSSPSEERSSGHLPTTAGEVEVRRRLHRSGESEYFLNRRLCRLRDIRELFMNTGIGVDAYSLIEQGKVDVILQGTPQERRIIFEEAAGISKYKAKRREAQRKLDRAEQNLLRLSDIISEIQRRLRSIKYQAGKARSYRRYSERLQELRLSYALNEYHELDGAHGVKAAEIASLRSRQSAEGEKLRNLTAERDTLEASLESLQRARQTHDEHLATIRAQIEKLQSQIHFNRNRLAETDDSIRRGGVKVAELLQQRRVLRRRLDEERQMRQRLTAKVQATRQDVEDLNRRVAEASDEARRLSQEAEQKKGDLIDLLQNVGERRNQVHAIEVELKAFAAQQERLLKRRGEIAGEVARLDGKIRELKEHHDEAIEQKQNMHQALTAKREEAEHCGDHVRGLRDDLARAREMRSGLESRRQLLSDLQRRGEGVNAAVLQALQWSNNQADTRPVRGMLADMLEVDLKDAPVIEAALGERQQMLVFDHFTDIERMIGEIGPHLQGRLQCLALDALVAQTDGRDISSVPGAIGWATELARSQPEVQPVINHLLCRTIVSSDLASARQMASGDFEGYRYVTTNREVLEADGTVSLGLTAANDGKDRAAAGLILRHSELREVEAQLAEVETRIENIDEQYGAAASRRRHLQADQEALQADMGKLESARVAAEAEMHHLAALAEQLHTETPLVEAELEDLLERRQQAIGRRQAVSLEIHGLEASCEEKEQSIELLASQVAETEQSSDALEQQHTNQQVTLAQIQEKLAGMESRCRDIESLLAGCNEGIRQSEQDLAHSKSRVAETETELLAEEAALSEAFADKERLEERSAEMKATERTRRDSLLGVNENTTRIEAVQDDLRTRMHAVELELRECQTNRENLVVRIRDDFDQDLSALHDSWEPQELDWNAIEEEIQNLRGKISRLGNVNLESIEEQDELQKREIFLVDQREDLQNTRTTLDRLIKRIDATSREKFLETFQAVRENFQELFRKLFAGGRADVILEDEMEPLECGIEIVAKPPGKELQRISLLSGGEKALSAVALLMAIFRARPSPFCILDEVDAALDEANTERFTSVIQDFMDRSQFIIVTHNKRTMAIADTLYGLTMAEAGVSRKISLQFNDIHNEASKTEAVMA